MAAEWRQQRLDGIDSIEARQSARRFSEARGISFRRAFRNILRHEAQDALQCEACCAVAVNDGRPTPFQPAAIATSEI